MTVPGSSFEDIKCVIVEEIIRKLKVIVCYVEADGLLITILF